MDNVSNMLITIKNGGNARKEMVAVPYSRFKNAIANALLTHGYIKAYARKKRKAGDILEIAITYKGTEPRVSDVKRISKPSRRVYISAKNIKTVRQGHGLLILSTPKGILTGDEAKKELVGGEALFEIW